LKAVNSGSATNNGYIIMPTIYWAVPNGPVRQPLWERYASRITYNGVNYVRVVPNDTFSALISPSNPEGLSGTSSGDFRHTTDIQGGFYAANFTDWLKGRLTTLAGFPHRQGLFARIHRGSGAQPAERGQRGSFQLHGLQRGC
jgi:hypothetical protein